MLTRSPSSSSGRRSLPRPSSAGVCPCLCVFFGCASLWRLYVGLLSRVVCGHVSMSPLLRRCLCPCMRLFLRSTTRIKRIVRKPWALLTSLQRRQCVRAGCQEPQWGVPAQPHAHGAARGHQEVPARPLRVPAPYAQLSASYLSHRCCASALRPPSSAVLTARLV